MLSLPRPPVRRIEFRNCLSWILTLILFIGSAVPSAQAADQPTALLPSIRRIQERGELVIGIPPYDTPPFYYRTGPASELEGYDVDVARTIARSLGVRAVFDTQSSSFNNLVRRAGRGEIDLAIGKLGTTYPRLFDAQPHTYMRFRQALLINRQTLSNIGREADPELGLKLRKAKLRIGAIHNSAYDTFAKDIFPKATIITAKDWASTVASLTAGKVDAIYRDANEIRMLTAKNPGLSLRYTPLIIDDMIDSKSIFISATESDLGPLIDFVVSNEFGISDDRQIIARYRRFYSPDHK